MKRHFLATAVAVSVSVFAQSASAQTCTGFSGSLREGNFVGDTCQAGGSALAGACNNAETLNGAGVAIYELIVGQPGLSYNITVNTTAFVPWLGYVRGTCSSNTTCIDDVTRSGPGAISISHDTDDTPLGTYYLIVGDVDVDTPGCGSFTLSLSAPVELLHFSVE